MCDVGRCDWGCVEWVGGGDGSFDGRKGGDDKFGRMVGEGFYDELCDREIECVDVEYDCLRRWVEEMRVGNDDGVYG